MVKKEIISVRNEIETMIYDTRKMIENNKNMISKELIDNVESQIKNANEKLTNDSLEVLKEAYENLKNSSMQIGKEIYSNTKNEEKKD